MKCPACWAEKAYRRPVKSFKDKLLLWLLFVPMMCHHCYHKFTAFRPMTLGKRIDPPKQRLKIADLPEQSASHQPRRRSERQSTDSGDSAPNREAA